MKKRARGIARAARIRRAADLGHPAVFRVEPKAGARGSVDIAITIPSVAFAKENGLRGSIWERGRQLGCAFLSVAGWFA